MPQTTTVGGSQFVRYESVDCLTQPNCYVTAICYLTITLHNGNSMIVDAKLEGVVNGAPGARDGFVPYVGQICNNDFFKRLDLPDTSVPSADEAPGAPSPDTGQTR